MDDWQFIKLRSRFCMKDYCKAIRKKWVGSQKIKNAPALYNGSAKVFLFLKLRKKIKLSAASLKLQKNKKRTASSRPGTKKNVPHSASAMPASSPGNHQHALILQEKRIDQQNNLGTCKWVKVWFSLLYWSSQPVISNQPVSACKIWNIAVSWWVPNHSKRGTHPFKKLP